MKLTIENLAPYLPYGLLCYTEGNSDENGKPIISVITGLSHDYVIIDGEHEEEYVLYEDVKPLMRRNSRKNFVINVNGFEINVTDEMTKIFGRNDLSVDMDLDIYIECDGSSGKYISMHDFYDAYSKLFEYRFDVFGLIEKNLAIDINTI